MFAQEVGILEQLRGKKKTKDGLEFLVLSGSEFWLYCEFGYFGYTSLYTYIYIYVFHACQAFPRVEGKAPLGNVCASLAAENVWMYNRYTIVLWLGV